MTGFRRFAALLALPLAFQQALALKGVVCVRQSMEVARGAGPEMGGMKMPAVPNGSIDDHRPNRAPCDKPFGPGDCQPFAACGGTVVLPPPAAIDVGNESPPARVASLIVLPPPSRTTAPEPPPPRI